jgi:two-component system chemotaxis sensor kinase CheA
MSIERSRVVDEWFGVSEQPEPFWDFMARHSRVFGVEFQLGWDQVMAGFLPLEVTVDQLPRRITLEHRTFSIRYLPFHRDGELDGILLVIADMTERLAKERDDAEQSELMQGFKRLMLDRSGFINFLHEATSMLDAIAQHVALESGELKRTLHTLKGNAAVMGLEVVARLCHALEEQIAENGSMTKGTLDELVERWNTITNHISHFIGDDNQRVIEVPEAEYDMLIRQLSSDPQHAGVLRQLRAWQLEPVERAFERLAEQGRALAQRLGKGTIKVVMEGNGVRLDADVWAPFFSSLVHVIRNSMDHGIEAPEMRQASLKPSTPTLFFKALAGPNSMAFEIGDDGQGIDWDEVATKAKKLGLPSGTPKQLLTTLLQGGVSTKSEVTDTSGRGVGMSAVLQRVETMQGTMDVRSVRGKGTTWIIRFPFAPSNAPTARVRRSSMPIQHISVGP